MRFGTGVLFTRAVHNIITLFLIVIINYLEYTNLDNLLSELESVLPPKPEPPSVSPTPPSSTRQSAVPQASVQNGTVVIEEPRYVSVFTLTGLSIFLLLSSKSILHVY